MSGTSKNGMQPTAKDDLRCVLLHAPGSTVPTTLLATLAKRTSVLVSFTDAYPALAEVFALGGNAKVLLVLVEPANLRDAAELVDAVFLHGPQTQLWWYSRAESLKLRRILPSDRTPWTIRDPASAAPVAPPPRQPRNPQPPAPGWLPPSAPRHPGSSPEARLPSGPGPNLQSRRTDLPASSYDPAEGWVYADSDSWVKTRKRAREDPRPHSDLLAVHRFLRQAARPAQNRVPHPKKRRHARRS